MLRLNKIMLEGEFDSINQIAWFLYRKEALEKGLSKEDIDELLNNLVELEGKLNKEVEKAYTEGYDRAEDEYRWLCDCDCED